MAIHPGQGWRDLKRELMSKWHELTENDLESTGGEKRSIIDLLERKVGMRIEDASEHFEEMAERYHLYDEPHEAPAKPTGEKTEKVLELSPKKPTRSKDVKPLQ